jgi:diguanylate cyclase (GGDEF)-like protein/PAS domain S-box-containing protein
MNVNPRNPFSPGEGPRRAPSPPAGQVFSPGRIGLETSADPLAAMDSDTPFFSSIDAARDGPPQLRAFAALMATSDCPVWVVDHGPAGHTVSYTNAALRGICGYEDEELIGRDWTFLFAPDAQSRASLVWAAMHCGLPVRETLRARHKSGADLWLEVHMSPVRNAAGILTHHIGVLRDLTAERRLREELEYRACHDPLTGLANRHLLQDRFEQARAHARRQSRSLAVVLLDMNGFKLVNDRFGHQEGDKLLRCLGARLAAGVRGDDTVARLGGDEFVLLLNDDPGGLDPANAVIARVAAELRRPIILRHQPLVLGCCAGVSRYPVHGSDLDALLEAADLALYQAKSRAREDPLPAAPALRVSRLTEL